MKLCETEPKSLSCVGFEYAFFLRSTFTLCCFRERYRWYAFINVDETGQKGLTFLFFCFFCFCWSKEFVSEKNSSRSWCGYLPCIWQKQLYHGRKHWSYRYGLYVNRDPNSESMFFGVPANRESQQVTWLVPCRLLCGLKFTFVWLDKVVDISEVSQGLLWPITSQAHVWEDIVPLRTFLLINHRVLFHRNVILQDDFLAKTDFNEWMKT